MSSDENGQPIKADDLPEREATRTGDPVRPVEPAGTRELGLQGSATNGNSSLAANRLALSIALMGFAGTVLGLIAAVIVFVLDKRSPGTWFAVLAALSVLCLVLSVVQAGKGISNLSRGGKGGGHFNKQVLFGAGSVVLLGLSLLAMGSSSDEHEVPLLKQQVENLEQSVRNLQEQVNSQARIQGELEGRLKELRSISQPTVPQSRTPSR
jgi:hypothetical protein